MQHPSGPPGAADQRYLALRARAVAFLADCGGSADEDALVREVLAASPGRPWRQLLTRILTGDERLVRDDDGRWRLRHTAHQADTGLPTSFLVLELGLMGSLGEWLEIVEVAALRVSDDVVTARFAAAVQPTRRPTAYAKRAAGLGDEGFATAASFDEVASELVAFLDDNVPLVGYDLRPQLDALEAALRRAGRPELGHTTLDLMNWLLDRGHLAGKPALTAALRALGHGEPPTARATDRAAALVPLVATLRATAPVSPAPAPAAHDRPRARPAYRWRLDDPPPAPGVYYLYDAQDTVLYAGSATDLQQRLRSYATLAVRQVRHMEGLHTFVARVDWETTPSVLSARLLEAQRIAEHRPRYNVHRRSVPRGAYLVARPAGPYLRLVVVPRPAAGEHAAGPFASGRAALQAWRTVADLCGLHTCRRTFRAQRPRPACTRHTIDDLCPAPCRNAIAPDDYAQRIDQALALLGGDREALLVATQAALAAARRDGDRAEAARLRRRAALAHGLPAVRAAPYAPQLVAGLVPAVLEEDAPPAAELFCLLDDALYPLQPVAFPAEATEVAQALDAALAAESLPAPTAGVAQTWLRQRPGAAATAITTDLSPAGRAPLATALARAWLQHRHTWPHTPNALEGVRQAGAVAERRLLPPAALLPGGGVARCACGPMAPIPPAGSSAPARAGEARAAQHGCAPRRPRGAPPAPACAPA